jgi:glycosyltransferase involved in cell wall biosynthesis
MSEQTSKTVALDISAVLTTPRTGVGHFVARLTQALLDEPEEFDFRLFASSATVGEGLREFAERGAWTRCLPIPTQLKCALWTRFEWPPLAWFTGRADAVHGAFHLLPPGRNAVRLVTVFDVTNLKYPETHTAESNRLQRQLLTHAAANADRVVVLSESTRADVAELLGVEADRCRVVPGAVDPDEFAGPLDEARLNGLCQRLGLRRPYLIHLGTLEPRKNLVRLVEAYNRLGGRHDDVPQLLLAGRPGWGYEPITEKIDRLSLQQRVLRSGYLDRADAVTLLRGAAACAYPSLYEGFGLPVLEAMAAGVPVVSSNASSLPEVAGDAAVLVDPRDVDAIEAGLRTVLEDDEGNAARVDAGRARAGAFTWAASAAALRGVYREALS